MVKHNIEVPIFARPVTLFFLRQKRSKHKHPPQYNIHTAALL